ncbi:MAG: NAD(P)H-hydrate dehydratase [Bacteroidales bacterium]|nr:NAD(P)H-hydrate dehydratase [Bacteroidales bacterium]
MKLFTANKIREADAYTIAKEPIDSIGLMERAANQLASWINCKTGKEQSIKIFTGPGNNGGDGWALARILSRQGYGNINLYLLVISKSLSPDSEINRGRLLSETKVKVTELKNVKDFPAIHNRDIIIDSLFGSGLTRPLEGLAADLVKYINDTEKSTVISVDIPSGLFAEDNPVTDSAIIHADYTLSFQFPKLSFFFPENDNYVGKFEILDIGLHGEFIDREPSDFNYTSEKDIADKVWVRNKYSHKGTYGHALIIAGSYGMMGATVLAAKAAMRSGAGLVTAHVPRFGVDIIQNSVPECLLSIDESDILFSEHPDLEKFTAIGVGPAINQKSNTRKAIISLLKDVTVPIVIDADALNILSAIDNWNELLPEQCILTPHPREFERLFGKFGSSYERMSAQQEFSQQNGTIVVLKGAHTCISLPDGQLWFNTTGNPGMATGGSGDALTGIILGLLSQGYNLEDAAITGVYIHGLAGDMAKETLGETGLIASDMVNYLGVAFKKIENIITK